MFSLDVQNEKIYLKDIKPVHLPAILQWYNKVDDFKYATGIDAPITLEMLTRKYAEVAISSHEFFAGIYAKKENIMIGIIKGTVNFKKRDAIWIRSIVIDTFYQNKGFGKMTVALLLQHLKAMLDIKSVYLAVIEENLQGKYFWLQQGFKGMRRIEDHLRLQDKRQNVIVMHKKIN